MEMACCLIGRYAGRACIMMRGHETTLLDVGANIIDVALVAAAETGDRAALPKLLAATMPLLIQQVRGCC
jgi:hypothetical protein